MQSLLYIHCLLWGGISEWGQERASPCMYWASTAMFYSERASCIHSQVSADRQMGEAELGIGMTENGFSFPVSHSWSTCRNDAEEFVYDVLWLFTAKIPENICCCFVFVCFLFCFLVCVFPRCLYFVFSVIRRTYLSLIPREMPERDTESWCAFKPELLCASLLYTRCSHWLHWS